MTKIYADNITESESGNTITRISNWVTEDGTAFFDIRKFYKTKNSDEFKPGKGISLPLDVETLDALIEAANKAKADLSKPAKQEKPVKSDKQDNKTDKPKSTLVRVKETPDESTPKKRVVRRKVRVGVKK
jgi:hypothetical protein